MASAARVLIYGGKGALGAACVSFFKSKNWVRCLSVNNVDLRLKSCVIKLDDRAS